MQKAQQISKVYGFGNNITTGLVMFFHPTEFGLYNEQGKQILKNLGYETGNSIETYQETLRNLKEMLKADDFLELDLFLYLFNKGKYETPRDEADSELGMIRSEELIIEAEQKIGYRNSLYPLPQLAEDTGFDEAELERWVRAIERKGQAILYGPPGTGKTFMAEKLAAHLVGGGDGFVELVQFHPTYAYEDFIQGIRPQSEGDHLSYPVVPGRFLEFCWEAHQRHGRCVLIIDEINRANLSRVFGELMYLLEYRDRDIPLAGGGLFKIPANVRLIGTMNTADRSIALVDHALRRRFAFITLYPNYELLRRYHQRRQTGFPVEGLIETLTSLNRQIGDRHYEVGVTFFLRLHLAEEIEDIWRMEIEPYLEEYFFDRPENVESFRWDKVKSRIL
jgi:5-methylcytosine-specific restriction protein B